MIETTLGIKIEIEELDNGGYLVDFFSKYGSSKDDKRVYVEKDKLLGVIKDWLETINSPYRKVRA